MEPEEELLQMHLLREESPNPHKLLLESLRAKHYAAFKSLAYRALDKQPPSIDINYVFPHPLEKTFLDIACSEGMEDFVKLLLEMGAKPNKINAAHNRAPIHFAVSEGHANVLKILLQDPRINPNLEVGRQTGLHLAVKQNDLKCAEILLNGNASPNIPNSKGLTALHMAASNDQEDMVRLILNRSKCAPDLDTFKDFRKRTTREILQQKLPNIALPPICEKRVDVNTLRYYLEANDEANFLKSLERVDDALKDNGELIKVATDHDLRDAVRQLIGKGHDDVTELAAAAEVAVEKGHYEVLKELFDHGTESSEKLLIKACQELGAPPRNKSDSNFNRMQCLKLMLSQPNAKVRCEDDKGNTPLHYAARAESSEAVSLLLKAGSYIGHRNILGQPPLAHMSPSVLSEFLDDCLHSSKERTEDYEIEFNYRCLMPHNLAYDTDREHLLPGKSAHRTRHSIEMEPFRYIANNHALKHLLKHPIFSSFLYLKWHRIRHILYANFIFYVIFYILLNTYILSMTYASDDSSNRAIARNNSGNDTHEELLVSGWSRGGLLWAFTAVALVILTARELLQLLSSPCHYISSFENWLEVTLIVLGFALLGNVNPRVGAIAILLSAWELVILIGQHPRMSTGIEMFKTVSLNFMRFLFLYAFLILAFALAFFTLFKNGGDQNFPDPGHSLFKTIIMLTGEFDANDIPFVSYPVLSHLVFVLFVFLIAIVLFNLLNGLAVSDTAEILEKAELVGLISRTRLIAYVESVVVGSPFFGNPRCCCYGALNRSLKINLLGFLARKVLFFPNYLPRGKLSVKPYKCNEIRLHGRDSNARNCFVLKMDPFIAARAKEILAEKGKVSDSEKLITEFDALKQKFEKFETILETIRLAMENNNCNPEEQE